MRFARLFVFHAAALALGTPGLAQTEPASRSGDIDIPSPRPTPRPGMDEKSPVRAVEDGSREEVFIPGRTDRKLRTPRQELVVEEPVEAVDAGSPQDPPDAGALAPEPVGEQKPALPEIVLPPKDGDARLIAAWNEREQASQARAFRTVQEIEQRILALREELGYENLFAMATAATRQAEGLLASDPTEAVRRALWATELAPSLPYAHWAVARAYWNEDEVNVMRYVGSAVNALRASIREPRWRGAALADGIVVFLAALLAAGLVVLLLVFGRHARVFFHDFNHLFPFGAPFAQTTLLAAVILALPWALGLGPALFLFGLALASWLYMSRIERVVVGIFLALMGSTPRIAAFAARELSFGGTKAETIYLIERGGLEGTGPEAALKAMSEQPDPSFQAAFAIGRQARRRGEAEAAVSWLRRASELRPTSTEAMVELGNALFLLGDLEGARESYQRAADRDPELPEPYYNLARLYSRKALLVPKGESAEELSHSQEASRKATELDPQGAVLIAGKSDVRANLFLAGLPLADNVIAELAEAETTANRLEDQIGTRLFGALPRGLAPAACSMAVVLLLALSLMRRPLAPSHPCHKCGRPVCKRCDAEVMGPALCGQCVHVFGQRAAVDPPARAAKEIGIRRHHRRLEAAIKAASLLASGAGHVLCGRTLSGSLLLAGFWMLVLLLALRGGIVPVPARGAPPLLRELSAGIGLVTLWFFAARRAFILAKGETPKE